MSDTQKTPVERFLAEGGTVTKLRPSERGRPRGWDRYTNHLRYAVPLIRKEHERRTRGPS